MIKASLSTALLLFASYSHADCADRAVGFGPVLSAEMEKPPISDELERARVEALKLILEAEMRVSLEAGPMTKTQSPKFKSTSFKVTGEKAKFRYYAVGDVMLQLGWGKKGQERRAFVFEGDAVVRETTTSRLILESLPVDRIRFVRNMGANEAELWRTQNYNELDSRPRFWGHSTPVVHLAYGGRSWIGSHRPVAAIFEVDRATLIRWLESGDLTIETTSIDHKGINIAIVVSRPAWVALSQGYVGLSDERMSVWKRMLSRASFGMMTLLGKPNARP